MHAACITPTQVRAERERQQREAEEKAAASAPREIHIPPLVVHPDCSFTLGSLRGGQQWSPDDPQAQPGAGGACLLRCQLRRPLLAQMPAAVASAPLPASAAQPPCAAGGDWSAGGGSRHGRRLLVPPYETAFSAVDLAPDLSALGAAAYGSRPLHQGAEHAEAAEEDAAALRRRLEREFLAAEEAMQQPADLEAGTARRG